MRRIGLRRLALVLPVFAAVLMTSPVRADDKPSTALLGKKIANVKFKDSSGTVAALHDFKGKKAVVVLFLSFDCPVSTAYSQPLTEMFKTYREREVAFVAVCPCEDDQAGAEKHAREFKLPFPVFKNGADGAVEALQAEVTPSVFVLDGDFVLRYRGRIDDGFAARLKPKAKVERNDLKEALDELLAGKEVSQPATKPIGCMIPRDDAPKRPSTAVTYYKDVLPILQKNCQGCHRPGEVGPFSLMTYKQAVNWSNDIKEYTQNHKMPPWKPVDGPAFRDERKMSDKDIATLAAWADGGTPAGDAKDAPPPAEFPKGWQLGKPDLVLTVDSDFTLGATGRDVFRCFVLPTGLTEDKYVTAVEVRPGNPRIVHHTLNFIDLNGRARKMAKDEADREKKPGETESGPGYPVAMGVGFRPDGALGGWAPGQLTRRLPADTGFLLRKGADVVVQVHYHRNGRVEKDRTQIGLYFAPKPLAKQHQTVVVAGRFFWIPAGNENYKVKGSVWVETDCDIHSVMPHMHMLGKEIKVSMTPPDGPTKSLVAIKDWDYNWQETYFFKESIPVKAGTRFDIEAVYDNSAKNPKNPNKPPKLVVVGEQTTDEMCFGFIGATSDKGRIRRSNSAPKKE